LLGKKTPAWSAGEGEFAGVAAKCGDLERKIVVVSRMNKTRKEAKSSTCLAAHYSLGEFA
jgi:hypothetical protein